MKRLAHVRSSSGLNTNRAKKLNLVLLFETYLEEEDALAAEPKPATAPYQYLPRDTNRRPPGHRHSSGPTNLIVAASSSTSSAVDSPSATNTANTSSTSRTSRPNSALGGVRIFDGPLPHWRATALDLEALPKLDKFPKWHIDMLTKLEEKKEAAKQKDKLFSRSLGSAAQRNRGPTILGVSQASIISAGTANPSPAAASAQNHDSEDKEAEASQAISAQWTESASIERAYHTITQCTMLERGYPNLKTTINPLFLFRAKANQRRHLAQLRHQQQKTHKPSPSTRTRARPPAASRLAAHMSMTDVKKLAAVVDGYGNASGPPASSGGVAGAVGGSGGGGGVVVAVVVVVVVAAATGDTGCCFSCSR
mmetsp:Transcript_7124/g.21802  ORF Transcript_7124/g.21802 Transcript_7124/m.21802 type:complete len:366 (+) Transcript_7124:1113-2210(+)